MPESLDYKIEEKVPYNKNGLPVSLRREEGVTSRSMPYETFLEQFLEPPIATNYKNPQMLLIPTWCTWLKIPVIDDADRLL